MKIYRSLFFLLLFFASLTSLARSTVAGLVVTATPTGPVAHNFTVLSGGTAPGAIGFMYQTAGSSNLHKSTSTYNSPVVTGPTTGVAVISGLGLDTQIWTDGAPGLASSTQQTANASISSAPGASYSVDLGSSGAGNTGLAAGQTYTASFFITDYCTYGQWTVSADDGSFLTQTGVFSQTNFSRGNETVSFQFTNSSTNSGATFTWQSLGSNCDGSNSYIGFGGYVLSTGAQPNPDGTPAPTAPPSASPTPLATPTPGPTAPAPTTLPYVPGGGTYNGALTAYAHVGAAQSPIKILMQPGATQDYLQIFAPDQVTKIMWVDGNGILHTNGGTSLLAYTSNGLPINATPKILYLNGVTPSTTSTSCGPYYPTGSYYCSTLTLPTGVAAFTSVSSYQSTFGINGMAQNGGTNTWYAVLGGTMFNVNWNSTTTLYVGSSIPSEGYSLELYGY